MGKGKWATVLLAVLVWALGVRVASACEDFALDQAGAAYLLASFLAGGPEYVPAFTGTPSFSDVDASNWALKYVQYCVALGVVKGYPDGTYRPGDPAARDQMAVYLARAVATPTAGADLVNYTPPATATFPDVPTSFWAYKYVEYLYAQGVDIACQTSPMLFCPGDLATAYTLTSWIEHFGVATDPCGLLDIPLDAAFYATPQSGTPPLTVQFTDASTAASCGYPSSWLWDFGDGATCAERNPSHVYAALGRYTVSLTVSNSHLTATVAGLIFVHHPPPVADFLGIPVSGAVRLTVQFTGLSYQGDPTAWLWDFGDGGTSIARNPSHDYLTPGRFTVALTASNDGGPSTLRRAQHILATFPDVPTDYWALDSILACTAAGIVQGYPDGTYGPAIVVTRDQMAVFISRALVGGNEKVPTGPATPHFADVPIDYWAYDYIEYARYVGVVQGYSDGLYHSADAVDRGQMSAYIARAVAGGDVKVPDGPVIATFSDVPTNYWAYKYVEYIANPTRAIAKGYPDGLYHPEYPCTRDQMAVYIQRAFKLPM